MEEVGGDKDVAEARAHSGPAPRDPRSGLHLDDADPQATDRRSVDQSPSPCSMKRTEPVNVPIVALPQIPSDTASVDTLMISLNTIKLVGGRHSGQAKLKSEIRDHGRQSWIPMDLAGGDS
jgi:hypothetical protein